MFTNYLQIQLDKQTNKNDASSKKKKKSGLHLNKPSHFETWCWQPHVRVPLFCKEKETGQRL